MKGIGKRLKELRSHSKFSAKYVADSIGVAESTYRDWEYGRSIKGEPYYALAKVFRVSLSELLSDEIDHKKSYVLKRLKQMETLISEIRTTI